MQLCHNIPFLCVKLLFVVTIVFSIAKPAQIEGFWGVAPATFKNKQKNKK